MSTKQNEHPLQYSWVFWEHLRANKTEEYLDAMRNTCEFSTVEEFWRIWTYLPRPSEVFFDGTVRKDGLGRKIEAFSMFKRGIRPEWEDPQNQKASEYSTAKPFDLDIDILWENLVLALIGETIEEHDEICGCRVVDKYRKGRTPTPNQPHYRLELWLRNGTSSGQAEKLKVRLLEALADGNSGMIEKLPPFEYKVHP